MSLQAWYLILICIGKVMEISINARTPLSRNQSDSKGNALCISRQYWVLDHYNIPTVGNEWMTVLIHSSRDVQKCWETTTVKVMGKNLRECSFFSCEVSMIA